MQNDRGEHKTCFLRQRFQVLRTRRVKESHPHAPRAVGGIGDAAHAMSPVGGVGINLAIQDAVATAKLLAVPLRAGGVDVDDLRRVQQRRVFPTRVTQWVQVQIQRRVIARALARRGPMQPPLVLRLLDRYPLLRRIPARLIGLGVRPEHVRVSVIGEPR